MTDLINKLRAALGTDAFAAVVAEVAALPAKEACAIANPFIYGKNSGVKAIRTRKEAIRQLGYRHNSILEVHAKRRATAGRSAA